MLRRPFPLDLLLAVAAFAISAIPVCAQPPADASAVPVTVTVTVLDSKSGAPPPLAREDFQVFSGKTRLAVTGWTKAQGQTPDSALQLAIVIDNSDSTVGVGSQLDDLAKFIQSQSPNTAVGLFYAVNGTVQAAAPFTTDHDAVAQKLRLPLGRGGGSSPSVYLSLDSLVTQWPSSSPGRREVLLFASGIDHMSPGTEDPYLDTATLHAQQAGVLVHTIFLSGARFDETFRGDIAQSNLSQLSDGSGGDAFSNDLDVMMSFAPYLRDMDSALQSQYLLTFDIDRGKNDKGEMRPIQLRTEQRNLQLLYPKKVFVPGPAQ